METHAVRVQYFKPSGKYYSEDLFEVDSSESWFDVVSDLRSAHGKGKPMPGLSTDGGSLYIYVYSETHPEAYPHLLLPTQITTPIAER